MLRAVIFDMDGTLIDSESTFYHAFGELLRPYGFSFSMEEYAAYYSGHNLIENMTRLVTTCHLPLTVEEARRRINELELSQRRKGVPLKPGAVELLGFLREHHLRAALATSSDGDRAAEILGGHGLLECFDCLVFGNEIAHGKPAPDIYLTACDRLKLAPDECLVLEDSAAGIHAAFAAGIPVICIPDLKQPDADAIAEASAVAGSLHEVMTLLASKDGSCKAPGFVP